jgi:hypothetical protein
MMLKLIRRENDASTARGRPWRKGFLQEHLILSTARRLSSCLPSQVWVLHSISASPTSSRISLLLILRPSHPNMKAFLNLAALAFLAPTFSSVLAAPVGNTAPHVRRHPTEAGATPDYFEYLRYYIDYLEYNVVPTEEKRDAGPEPARPIDFSQ